MSHIYKKYLADHARVINNGSSPLEACKILYDLHMDHEMLINNQKTEMDKIYDWMTDNYSITSKRQHVSENEIKHIYKVLHVGAALIGIALGVALGVIYITFFLK